MAGSWSYEACHSIDTATSSRGTGTGLTLSARALAKEVASRACIEAITGAARTMNGTTRKRGVVTRQGARAADQREGVVDHPVGGLAQGRQHVGEAQVVVQPDRRLQADQRGVEQHHVAVAVEEALLVVELPLGEQADGEIDLVGVEFVEDPGPVDRAQQEPMPGASRRSCAISRGPSSASTLSGRLTVKLRSTVAGSNRSSRCTSACTCRRVARSGSAILRARGVGRIPSGARSGVSSSNRRRRRARLELIAD